MASVSSRLCEEQFQCSICLDVFTDPVSTPCGHNFCKTCIKAYWDNTTVFQCPLCKESFQKRPELRVNTAFRDVVDQFRSCRSGAEVFCDACSEPKTQALKSCLDCVASYCETHLEPHKRVASFKKHQLMDPVENLEDRVCEKHGRPLELFCEKDQKCVCELCAETNHRGHETVPLETECFKRKMTIGTTVAEMQQMIQERTGKVKDIRHSMELSGKNAGTDIKVSTEVYTALMRSMERSQADLMEVIKGRQKAAESEAERLIKDLDEEIFDLRRRSTELEQLSQTKDHLHLLQRIAPLNTLPPMKDWAGVSVDSDPGLGAVRGALSSLVETLNQDINKMFKTELERIQKYSSVDLTQDTDPPEEKKEVKSDDSSSDKENNLTYCPDRFYFERDFKENDCWALGVARESVDIDTIGSDGCLDGCWAIAMRGEEEEYPPMYITLSKDPVCLTLTQKPQKVGVFLDHEKGQVSFYDVDNRSHIYTFTGQNFTEKLKLVKSDDSDEDD